jgi:uncharacterized protein
MACSYCYYLEKESLFEGNGIFLMPEVLLEEYIVQHIEASTGKIINFSWHGGEPTLAGLDFYRKVVEIQKRNCPRGKSIRNGIQTNATLLDREWCRFLANEHFVVGVSLDGPRGLHDLHRYNRNRESTFEKTLWGISLLQEQGLDPEVLCVVSAGNVLKPLEVYRFIRSLDITYVTFLPLVERDTASESGVSANSVPADAFGDFLITVFDEWKERDIGKIKVQIFEEALRTAFGQEHTLCIFKTTCGGVPVVEHNGDFYSCDHFVNDQYRLGNILETHLSRLLDSHEQHMFGRAKLGTLPRYCLECTVRDMCGGECPKNRFIRTPAGEEGLNYLCAGYKKFFLHCRPLIHAVSETWKAGN